MIKKFLIIGSKKDSASRNIIMHLMEFGRFDFHIIDGEMLDEKNLNQEKISKYDLIIFASKHSSKKKEKTLSVHSPGNWKEVWGGGLPNRISPASAQFNKHLFQKLKKYQEEFQLKYKVTLECTHHGPLIDRPSVFIEIGSQEEQWKDRRAGFCVAKAIKEAIETWKENPYEEIGIGIGGPHYCPSFNKLQLNSNVGISHIIPKYVAPITEEMILEALNNTIEEVDFAILDWKGLGKKEERDKVIEILEKNYIHWKKISEVKR
jgi:D-aminoacyl-tRNA deacylase